MFIHNVAATSFADNQKLHIESYTLLFLGLVVSVKGPLIKVHLHILGLGAKGPCGKRGVKTLYLSNII
jgi:hypothetical protein